VHQVRRVHRAFRVGSRWVRLRQGISAMAVDLWGRPEDLAKAPSPVGLEHLAPTLAMFARLVLMVPAVPVAPN
jgi:hypothetical protein